MERVSQFGSTSESTGDHLLVEAPAIEVVASRFFIHRIGGGQADNLRLKPKEETRQPAGISVIKAMTAADADQEIRMGFPKAKALHELAKSIGSASEEAIRLAGFDVIPKRSRLLPNHHRLIHPDGAAGFSDTNLTRLSSAFVNTTGHEP